MSLAIFDLDNTLLDGDSDYLWGEFLVEQNIVDGQSYRQKNDQFYTAYKEGTLDIYAFLEFSLAPLTQFSLAELTALHSQFMAEKIVPIMLPKAFKLLDSHKKNKDYLLIITATNQFVTQPIADKFGVHELIATEAEIKDGRYTGKVKGIPCFKQGKVARLNKWLESNHHNLEDSWFYSDSHNDLPLLELVTHPVAVDADDILLQQAKNHNWLTMSLKRD